MSATTAPPTPVGRAREMERLAQIVDAAVGGQKRAAALIGVAGIGKTTLLRWAYRLAAERGCLTAFVRAPATAGLPPRFPLGELLEGLIASCEARALTAPTPLRKVVDTLRGTTTAEEYPAALPQIAEALESTAALAPVALFLDDYHWAPAEGAELLIATLRVIDCPLVFITAARLATSPGALQAPETAADLWVEYVELTALDYNAVEKLAEREMAGPILPELVSAVFERTFGNPLFAMETLRSWRDSGRLRRVGAHWTFADASQLPTLRSLEDVVSRRISSLSAELLSLVAALAVVGRDASFEELQTLTGNSQQHLVTMLDLLAEQRIIAMDSAPYPRFRFLNPLYSSAVLEIIGPARIAALHQDVLQMILHTSYPLAELAHHALHALSPPSNMRDLVASAAEEAERAGSHVEAAAWYGYLTDLVDEDVAARAAAMGAQARLSTKFEPTRATALFTHALAMTTDPTQRSRLLFERANAQRIRGDFAAAESDLEEAIGLADEVLLPFVKHRLAVIHGLQGDTARCTSELSRLLERFPTSDVASLARSHLGVTALMTGKLRDANIWFEQAYAETQGTVHETDVLPNLGWVQMLLGLWPAATRTLDLAISTTESRGDYWNLNTALGNKVRLLAWQGSFRSAFESAARASRIATHIANPMHNIDWAGALSVALVESGMAIEARHHLETFMTMLPQLEPQEHVYTISTLIEACLLSGDPESARDYWHVALGHLHMGQHWIVVLDRLDAELLNFEGRIKSALDKIEELIETPTLLPFEVARVLESASVLAEKYGDRALALRRAKGALDCYERLGAAHRTTRLTARVSLLTPGKAGRPRSLLPRGVTERELQVLRLVVNGLSNQEIADELVLSVGTVRKHVENLMTKANASRRTQLLRLATEIDHELAKHARRQPPAPT